MPDLHALNPGVAGLTGPRAEAASIRTFPSRSAGSRQGISTQHEVRHRRYSWGWIVDVIDAWDGRKATALRKAFRMTQESFADHLGVSVRTVGKWSAEPDDEPRPDMQQILDTAYERASDSVRRRFSLLIRPTPEASPTQALRVAIAVVRRGDDVLLVCRRGSDSLSWQFPAGVVKPGATSAVVAEAETRSETGVRCTAREHLGSRVHPVTGVVAEYHACEYLMGEAANLDQLENADVAWVPIGALQKFIPPENIFPPILSALEAA